MADNPSPTDAELDELEKHVVLNKHYDWPLGLSPVDVIRLIKALRACRQHGGAALEVLQDWENTPGNHRGAAWWHEWERKRRAALGKGVGDADG